MSEEHLLVLKVFIIEGESIICLSDGFGNNENDLKTIDNFFYLCVLLKSFIYLLEILICFLFVIIELVRFFEREKF